MKKLLAALLICLALNSAQAISSIGGTAMPGYGIASEQTVGDIDTTWLNGNTTLRRTAALSANRNVTLPAPTSFSPGSVILYYDSLTTSTSTFAVNFVAAGTYTVNGTSSFSPFMGGGSIQFASDGVGAWIPMYQRTTGQISLQDSTDPTKQMTFSLAGFTTGNTRVMTPPDANFHPAALELNNVFTGENNQFVHVTGAGKPALSMGPGAGTTPSAFSINGNDMFFQFNFIPGTSPTGTFATIATFTFATPYAAIPWIIGPITIGFGATTTNSGASTVCTIGSRTTTGFTLVSGSAAIATGTGYSFGFIVTNAVP